MSQILAWLAENPAGLYLLNVTLGVTVFSSLGLLATGIFAGRSAPLRHGILLATLLLILAAPCLVVVNHRWNLGWLELASRPQVQQFHFPLSKIDPKSTITISSRAIAEEDIAALPVITVSEHIPRICAIVGIGLLAFWIVGTVWQTVMLVRGLWFVCRFRRSLRPAEDVRWNLLSEEAACVVGLRKHSEVFVSDRIASPVSLGIFRPVVVIPNFLERTLQEAEMQAILVHESAHIAQRDHLTGLLQRVVQILFWWHPLVRRLTYSLNEVKEELCDNYVVLTQGSGVPLARCLVKLAEWTVRVRNLPIVVGLLGSRRPLDDRVSRLLKKERNTTTRLTRSMVVPLALFVLAASGLTAACAVKTVSPAATKDTTSAAKETDELGNIGYFADEGMGVQEWLEQMKSSDPELRNEACRELRKFGTAILPLLKEAMQNRNRESCPDIKRLIVQIEKKDCEMAHADFWPYAVAPRVPPELHGAVCLNKLEKMNVLVIPQIVKIAEGLQKVAIDLPYFEAQCPECPRLHKGVMVSMPARLVQIHVSLPDEGGEKMIEKKMGALLLVQDGQKALLVTQGGQKITEIQVIEVHGGKGIMEEYTAKNAEELKKKHPKVYQIYLKLVEEDK